MKKQSFLSSLFSSVAFKVIGYFSGFFKHIIIAAAIGLSGQLDSFYIAMAFIGILITTWVGALEFVAMPILVKAEVEGDDKRFGKVAGEIFLAGAGASVLITILAVAFRDHLTVFAIGFGEQQREQLADAFVWLAPVMLFSFPLGLFGAILRAKRHFSLFYMSEALLAVVLLGCLIVASGHPTVLLWSMSLGTASACVFTGIFAVRHIRIPDGWFSRESLEMFGSTPALMLLFGVSSIFVVLDRIFASFLDEGSISALAYGLILVQVTIRLFGIKDSFITVAAEKKGRGDRAETLNNLLSLIIYISAGSVAFTMVAGSDIITLLFERGAFVSADTAKVVSAMLAFAFMVAPGFVIQPLDQIYLIEKRIGSMVRRTLVGIVAAIILNYIAVFVLGWGIAGLAIATTISYWIIALLAVIGLHRSGYQIAYLRHLKWAGWCILFMAAGSGAVALLPELDHQTSVAATAVVLGILLLAAGLLYPASREAELLAQVRARILSARFT